MQVLNERINNTGKGKGLVSRQRLFFFIFAVLIFAFVVFYLPEIRQEFRMLKKLNSFWLLLAFVFQLLTYLLNAFIYRLLLKIYHVPHPPSLKEFYKVAIIALVFNQTIPSAGISGNTFLFGYLEKKKIPAPSILSLILLELLSFYIAIEFIILLFAAFAFFNRWPYVVHSVLIAGFLVYLVFTFAVILIGTKKTFDRLRKRLGKRKLFKAFFRKVQVDFEQMEIDRDSVNLVPVLKKQTLIFTKAFFLQLLLIISDLFTIVALFAGLGLDVSVASIALALICTKIVSLLPFSPGALILYESSMTFFFVRLGIALAPALIVTLIYRLLSFWLPIPAGLLLYHKWLNKRSTEP